MMLGGTIFCQIFSRVVMLEITYKKNQRCSDGFVSFRMNNWLVVWNMAFIMLLRLSIQLGMSSSQLTNPYFSEGLKPPTRNE